MGAHAAHRPSRRSRSRAQNTLAAMRAAIGAGVDMVEFDVAPGLFVGHDGAHAGPGLASFLAELAETPRPSSASWLI